MIFSLHNIFDQGTVTIFKNSTQLVTKTYANDYRIKCNEYMFYVQAKDIHQSYITMNSTQIIILLLYILLLQKEYYDLKIKTVTVTFDFSPVDLLACRYSTYS